MACVSPEDIRQLVIPGELCQCNDWGGGQRQEERRPSAAHPGQLQGKLAPMNLCSKYVEDS